jgi:hypothetical protein
MNVHRLSTHGHAYANPGPFCRLALSTRIAVNLFVQVETPEDAKIAALTGAHCIVLKGNSSGGTWRQNKKGSEAALYNSIPNNHNQQEASIEHKTYPLSKLIPDSKQAIEELNLKNPPFLIAAGGKNDDDDDDDDDAETNDDNDNDDDHHHDNNNDYDNDDDNNNNYDNGDNNDDKNDNDAVYFSSLTIRYSIIN